MDPMLVGGLMGAGSAVSSYFQNKENIAMQRETNAHNAQLAQNQMNFQERMSNTAHQREASDLEAAGLNRILGVSGSGASAPGGASSTAVAPQSRIGDILKDSVNTGLSLMQAKSDLAIKDATVAKTLAETSQAMELHPQRLDASKSTAKRDYWESIAASSKAQTAMHESGTASEEHRQAKYRSEREAADTPRAVKQSIFDESAIKYDNVMRRVQDAVGTAASSAAALSRSAQFGRGMKLMKPPVIKAGSRAETRALERAGARGLEIK